MLTSTTSPQEATTGVLSRGVGRPTSRRNVVSAGAVGALALVGGAAAPRAAFARQDAPATIVLVNGSWAGAWIWRDVIASLRAAGHNVYAATLTGMGDRVHLTNVGIDLSTHVTDVVNLIEFEDLTDVHLVGWSYSGLVITGVAEAIPERLAQ